MDIAIETLASFWDTAFEQAPAQAGSMRQQLRNYEIAVTQQFQTVGSIGALGKNGMSQSYRGPGIGSHTNIQIQTAWRGLIKLYDQNRAICDWLNAQAVPWFVAQYPAYGADPDQAVYDAGNCWLNDNDFTSTQDDLTMRRVRPTRAACQLEGATW